MRYWKKCLKALRSLPLFSIVLLSTLSIAEKKSAADPYLFDLPETWPVLMENWSSILPSEAIVGNWITELSGVSTPIRKVKIAGKKLKYGWICKPHECYNNQAGVLFNPDTGYIVSVAQIWTASGALAVILLGEPTKEEIYCIKKLMEDKTHSIWKCP